MKNRNKSYYLHSICKLIFLVALIFCCTNKTTDATEDEGKETRKEDEGKETRKEDPEKELMNAIKTKASIDTISQLITKAYGDSPSIEKLNALLCFAVNKANGSIVDMLISKGANKNIKDPFDKGNLLHRTVEGSDPVILEHLITKHKLDINAQDKDGHTPLQAAICEENLEMMRVLIKNGADVNITTGVFTDSALHCAIDGKSKVPEMIDLLCSLGKANVDIQRDLDGYTPLHNAVLKGDKDVIKKLLEFKPSLTLHNKDDRAALSLAVGQGKLEMVRILLENGADPNLKNNESTTPLMIATATANNDPNANSKEIMQLLLDKGANPQIECDDLVPLQNAINKGILEVVEILINHPSIDINYFNEKTASPLHIAVENGNIEVVKALLTKNPNLEAKGYKSKDTPLSKAIQANRLDVAQLLLDAGADINALDKEKQSMLAIAIVQNLPKETITFLFKKGINPNTKSSSGTAPIHFAIESNNIELLSILLTNDKIDTELKPDKPNITPIFFALSKGNYEMVELLLQKGAKLNEPQMHDGSTLIHYAAYSDDIRLIELLIKYNADLNVQDNGGATPIHYACEMGNVDVVKILLKKGVLTDAKTQLGKMPIDIAVEQKHADIVKLLKTSESFDKSKPKGPAYTTREEAMKAFGVEKKSLDTQLATIEKKLDAVVENMKKSNFSENANTLAEMRTFLKTSIETLENFISQTCMQPEDRQQVQATLGELNKVREKMITYEGISTLGSEEEDNMQGWILKILSEDNVGDCYKNCRVAIRKGSLEPLKYLLEYKNVPISTLNSTDGNTLLHFAVLRNASLDLVKYLLNKGVDSLVKNSEGKTALDIANLKDNSLVARIIKAHMRRKNK